jgi:hypothetical protein
VSLQLHYFLSNRKPEKPTQSNIFVPYSLVAAKEAKDDTKQCGGAHDNGPRRVALSRDSIRSTVPALLVQGIPFIY